MPRITLRDHKVHFQQIGSGPDIVLLHGLSCHIAFWWFGVAPQLAETHRVTAVDLRGHGFTAMTESGYRPCDLAKDVAALIEHLGIERTHLVGHSFGGAVAAALATERPELVSEITLADAWLPSLQPVPPLLSGSDWSATLVRARSRGIMVEQNLPLVVRSLVKEMLDEHEFKGDGDARPHVSFAETTWEEPSRSRRRDRLVRLGRDGLQFGWALASPLRSRATRQAGVTGMQESAAPWSANAACDGRAAPSERDGQAAPSDLHGAMMMMTGKPGEASVALRRWQELMRRTQARAEYLDTSGIDAGALSGISAPVRLVYGARSLYRPSALRMKELLPKAGLRIIPRAGHYFPLLRPQALLEAMEIRSAIRAQEGAPAEPAQRLRLVASSDPAPTDSHPPGPGGSVRRVSGAPRA